jgi:hypothetical protein
MMKKILLLILGIACISAACTKKSGTTPEAPSKPLQIVVSNITTTLTIYNVSITNQSSADLMDLYAQTVNKTYTVNVKSGDILKIDYMLELEGVEPPVAPVITFVYEGVTKATVTNLAGKLYGTTYIAIP